MKIINHNQQPEAIACQGGGEMFKTCLSNQTRVGKVGNLSQNPLADIKKVLEKKKLRRGKNEDIQPI